MRIRLVTSNGMNIQSLIDKILTHIKETNNDEKEIIMKVLQECINIDTQKYISRKSYQKKKRQNFDVGSTAVDVNDLTDEEKNKITQELIDNSINPYSIERTNVFFELMFKESKLPFIKSKYIKNKEDALMFVSAFIYSGEDEFDFTVELDEGYEKTIVADISNMVVRRKK